MPPLQYDPHQHTDPNAWLALDESERIELVRQYHWRERIRLPNETLHATTHVIVENQVALKDPFQVRDALLRLMEEGLDRHEALHAIGWVLAKQLFAALTEHGGADLTPNYMEKLKKFDSGILEEASVLGQSSRMVAFWMCPVSACPGRSTH